MDTVRYYQAKQLLPAPRRKGRVALYGREHAERIRRIRALQRKGLTLAAVRRVLAEPAGLGDVDLAAAVLEAREQGAEDEFITLDEVAERSGLPAPLLAAIERDGLAVGREVEGQVRYTLADAELLKLGLKLLESGVPLGELLTLGHDHDVHIRSVAERAIELFDEHVRKPIRASAASDEEAAERVVAAFRAMLPAATGLVANHFQRILLAAAEERLARVGATSALPSESKRRGVAKAPSARVTKRPSRRTANAPSRRAAKTASRRHVAKAD